MDGINTMSNIKHGKSKTPVWFAWINMRRRANDPKFVHHARYVDRGITVCERWNKFTNFLVDMGEPKEGQTLERKNNDGNYEPDNCVWATSVEQARNRRTSKLTARDICMIRESALARWQLAQIFDVHIDTIRKVQKRRAWKDIQ
jgi:hypothetical protein